MVKPTRQEAIAKQKNPGIRARLERMTDAEFSAHQERFEASVKSGAVARTVARLASEAKGLRR